MQGAVRLFLAILLIACCVIILPSSAQPPIGGDNGWYAVHCNVDGASVYFDNEYKGVIEAGVLYVPVYTTGTPYQSFRVEMDGYTTYYGDVTSVPAKGEVFDLYATLNPVQPTSPPVIGGDIGWYTVHCNVDGATVMFDNEVKGVISQGTLSVQVYTTGTPYQTFTVSKDGYTPYTATITQYPAKGETVDLYATLNPVATSTPTPQAPLSPALAGGALLIVGLLFVSGRKN
jgi:phosphatidate phosphatase APP1